MNLKINNVIKSLWFKLDVFLHNSTPLGDKKDSKIIYDDFIEKNLAFNIDFIPKNFLELAKIHKQLFQSNLNILKYEWQKQKNRMNEEIQGYFHSKNYEIINLQNFCNSNIFQGISIFLKSYLIYFQ